jgi:mono/diheme cytochrome c family protein
MKRREKLPWRAALLPVAPALYATLAAAPLSAQEITPPSGVTVEQVRLGFDLYHGKGACGTCHGELGVGAPDGPPLVVGQWKLGPGTMEWLAHMTRHAGWGATSRHGEPQPMRGPTVLDSAEVRAVASYVWSISRGRVVKASP